MLLGKRSWIINLNGTVMSSSTVMSLKSGMSSSIVVIVNWFSLMNSGNVPLNRVKEILSHVSRRSFFIEIYNTFLLPNCAKIT